MPAFETPLGSKSSLLLPTISKVAVIGAGAAGLPTAKRLRDYGLEVVIFERNPAPGGVWIYREEKPIKSTFPSVIPSELDESSRPPEGQELPFTEIYDETIWTKHAPPGACYESLVNNIETSLMRFQGHEYPPGTGSFVNYQRIVEYLQRFARVSKLDGITRYNTYVGNVRRIREGGKSSWKVLSRRLHRDDLGRAVGTWSEETFDAVVIATGHYHTEYIPDIPGLSEWAKKWPQDIFHSKEFRRAENFDGKNILLFGTGFSSLDIAREISPFARRIYRVVRKDGNNSLGSKVLKNAINLLAPKNLTQIAEIGRFGPVEHAAQPCEGEIFLKDGTVLKGIDGISFCTGYLYVLPFLRSFHGNNPPSTSEDPDIGKEADVTEKTFVTDGMRLHNLHKDIFYIQDPTLAFIGVPFGIATFAFFEVQAMAVAAVFAGKAFLPSVPEMQAEYQAREVAKGTGRGFHELGPDLERDYVEDVVNWVNRDAEKSRDKTRVKGYHEGWYEDRVAGMDRLLRSVLSRKEFYPGLDAEEIEARVQEQNRMVERLLRAAAAGGS